MTESARVLLVGLGRIARLAHLPALAQLPDVIIEAAVDVAPPGSSDGSRELDSGTRVFRSLDEGLADGTYDVAVVAVPTPEHVDVISKCADAGLPVITEKPAAPTSALVEILQARTPLRAVHNFRSEAGPLALKDLCDSGELGPLEAVRIRHGMEHAFPGSWPARQNWRETSAEMGGGVLLDLGYHGVYLAEWLAGEQLTPVKARIDHHERVEVDAEIRLEGASGLAAEVSVSWTAPAHELVVEVVGRDATATWWAPDVVEVEEPGSCRRVRLEREPGMIPAYRRFFEWALQTSAFPPDSDSAGVDVIRHLERARSLART